MGVRERILSIRLMEKANVNPAVAEQLGIVVHKLQEIIDEDKADKA